MRQAFVLLLWCGMSVVGLAQQPAATPKKDPFADFGHTGLGQRPGGLSSGGLSRPAAPTSLPGSPSTATIIAPEPGATGIALSNNWAGHTTESSGGQTRKMDDLRVVMAGYGTAEADLGVHPEVTIYEGPVAGGAPGENCRITYLMPLDRAEAAVMKSRGISTVSRAVAPGLPDGLFLHTYDVHLGIYNRLCLVADSKKPMRQVVSVVLKAEGVNWYPPSPPFVKLKRDWHTVDYVDAENRGQPGLKIDTRVNDLRKKGGYIVVNTTGGYAPDYIPEPGIVLKPARHSPKEDATWYVPLPLVKLINYCLGQTLGGVGGPTPPPQ